MKTRGKGKVNVIEPLDFVPAKVFQKALFDAGIPLMPFNVDNLEKEYERLRAAGVSFIMQPNIMGPVKIAVLNDTCGNNIQLVQAL